MKKLLMIFTNYRELGGEAIAFQNEYKLFNENYEVKKLIFNNNYINFNSLIGMVTNNNPESVYTLKKELLLFKPDVVYLGNLWFQGSLGILKYLLDNEFKVILKLHNYRFDCINGIHFRRNNICHDCNIRGNIKGVINKCYKDSYLQSAAITNHSTKLFKLLKHKSLKILTLTNFQKNYLINLGIDSKKIYIFENYIEDNNSFINEKSNYFISVGRLEKEKGVEEIVKVWKNLNNSKYKLLIVGTGPEESKIRNLSSGTNIQMFGKLSNAETLNLVVKSKMFIFNSKLYEGQPTVLSEASIHGIPSIFPNSGGLNEFFPKNYKFMFEPGELEQKIDKALKSNINNLGSEVKKYFKQKISKEILLNKFAEIIDD